MTWEDLLAYCLAKPGAWQDEPWEGDVVEIGVANRWIKWGVEKSHLPLLADALRRAGVENPEIRLSVSPRLYQTLRRSQQAEAERNTETAPEQRLYHHIRLLRGRKTRVYFND